MTAVVVTAAPRRPSPRRRPWLQPTVAVASAVLFLGVPLWLVFVTSGKSAAQTQIPSLTLPHHQQFASNYSDAYSSGKMLSGLVNSLLVVVPAVTLTVVFAGMASWVLARRTSRIVGGLYSVAVSGMLLPASVITMTVEMRHIGLQDSRIGLILAYIGMFTSVAIFFMTGFIRTLPIDVEEAARIDGAGPLRIYFNVVLPLLSPVVITASILITLLAWNDLFYAFFILGGGSKSTLPLNLYQVASTQLYVNNWHLIFSFVVLVSLPLVAVFALAQRRIVSGVTSGAVK